MMDDTTRLDRTRRRRGAHDYRRISSVRSVDRSVVGQGHSRARRAGRRRKKKKRKRRPIMRLFAGQSRRPCFVRDSRFSAQDLRGLSLTTSMPPDRAE